MAYIDPDICVNIKPCPSSPRHLASPPNICTSYQCLSCYLAEQHPETTRQRVASSTGMWSPLQDGEGARNSGRTAQ